MNRRTEAQRLASRINGAKSRGPVTPEGKQRVSQNAVKLGIHARRAVLANENPEAWDALLEALTELWQPDNIEELRLVHQIAAAHWRIMRLQGYECALMDLETLKADSNFRKLASEPDTLTLNAVCWNALDENGTLTRLARHEARLERSLDRARAMLVAIQLDRRSREEQQHAPAPKPAAASLNWQNKPEPRTPDTQNKPDRRAETSEPAPEIQPPDAKAA